MSWNEGAKAFIAGADIEARRRVKLKSGTTLYGADGGKLSDTASGSAQAVALEAAQASGQHLEVLLT